jgi:hypothetical protein
MQHMITDERIHTTDNESDNTQSHHVESFNLNAFILGMIFECI